MDDEFEIDKNVYKHGKMDARHQLHVCRRVTPLMAKVPDMLSSKDNLLARIGPIAMVLAEMSDEDVDYVIDKCMSIVVRKQPGDTGWAKVWNSAAQRPMFDDIELPVMLKLTARVIIDTIVPFLPALASVSTDKAQAGASKR